VYVRVAPETAGRRLIAVVFAFGCMAAGCSRASSTVTVAWHVEPRQPVTGPSTVFRLSLLNEHGQPLRGASLRLDAHMPHPGMAPVSGDVVDRGDGEYEARLRLTMEGDWVVVVTGTLADGSRITGQTQVVAVRPTG
jgi:YtkA-like